MSEAAKHTDRDRYTADEIRHAVECEVEYMTRNADTAHTTADAVVARLKEARARGEDPAIEREET